MMQPFGAGLGTPETPTPLGAASLTPLTRRYFLGLLSPNCLVNDVLANPESSYGFPDFGLISSVPGVFLGLDRRRGPSLVRADQQHICCLANELHVL
jgi:hypothetical protein